jgi:hypothetical protein
VGPEFDLTRAPQVAKRMDCYPMPIRKVIPTNAQERE